MGFGWPTICSLLFNGFCFMGFSFQAANFVRDYFAYATESDLSIETPVEVPVPDFTVCFRYIDVLDYDLLRAKYPNSSVKAIEQLSANEDMEIAISRIQELVTIQDIFTFSPAHDKILSQCSCKGPKDFEFQDLQLNECNKLFTVWKFYLQEYICYRFKKIVSAENRDFQYRLVSYAIDRPGTLFTLKTNNKKLLQTRYLKAVVHSSNKNPEASLAMTTNIKRRFDDENLGEKDDIRKNYFIFLMTYSDLQMFRKEPPYDTGCRYYNQTSEFPAAIECRTDCLVNRTMKALNKAPFAASLWNWTAVIQYLVENGDASETTENLLQQYLLKEQSRMATLNYHHVTSTDLLNKRVSDQLMQIESECLYLCRRPDCDDAVTLTRGSYDYIREEDLKTKDGQFLEFEISVPKKPMIIINYKEKVSSSEFLVYLLSCFGIWFGLSVLSVNPFNLKAKLRGLRKTAGEKDFCIQIRDTTRERIREEVEAIKRQITRM